MMTAKPREGIFLPGKSSSQWETGTAQLRKVMDSFCLNMAPRLPFPLYRVLLSILETCIINIAADSELQFFDDAEELILLEK